MADIEMIGGSDFHMEHSTEKASQHGGGSGSIDMYGGSDFHIGTTPVGSEQKGKGDGGIDMVGTQGLVSRDHVSPYGSVKPSDKGME